MGLDHLAMGGREDWLEALLPSLQRLDGLLEGALAAAQAGSGQPSPASAEDRGPGPEAAAGRGPIGALQRCFGLGPFDTDLVVIALAPEIDRHYERLYTLLQGQAGSCRPTVDLALFLLCGSVEERLARQAHLAPGAPLLRHGLLRLVPGADEPDPPLPARHLRLDEQVTAHLLGRSGLDPRLARCGTLTRPAEPLAHVPVDGRVKDSLAALAGRAWREGRPLRLYLQGPPGVGRRRTARGLASELGLPLLELELTRAPADADALADLLAVLFRQARLDQAVTCLRGLDAVTGWDPAAREQLMAALRDAPGVTVLTGTLPWASIGRPGGRPPVLAVPLDTPGFELRRACWAGSLREAGAGVAEEDLDVLAGRFRLTAGSIADAVADACELARWRRAAHPGRQDLLAAARARSGQELTALARRIEPRRGWDDLVLPADQRAQLREVCEQAAQRHVVYGQWGFGRRLAPATGLNVLFYGPSGTGKTVAAEVVAGALALDLYKIDLARVVSKYIGETEKNLDHVFTLAERANGVLLFDEADTLYGRRSEVRDAHDRYANLEVGYLLQKMEEHEGIAILATNLRHHVDDAFTRRMHVIVEFPLPDEEHRRRIWEAMFPREAPLGDDVDVALLARDVKLPGGSIRNIALAAAFYAAGDGRVIRMAHLLRAARREHQKLGRTWNERDPLAIGVMGP